MKGSWSILQLCFIAYQKWWSRIHADSVIVIPSSTLIQVLLFHHKFIFYVSLLLLFTALSGFLVLKLCFLNIYDIILVGNDMVISLC